MVWSIDKTGNEHVSLITRVCLSTGARWGEAEGLTAKNIRNGQVDFTDTKSGKIALFQSMRAYSNNLKSI